MNRSELALAMLKWEALQQETRALEAAITAAILETKETQRAGNVSAVYREARKTYSYEEAVNHAMQTGCHPNEIIDRYTYTTTKTDWRKAALEGIGINPEDIPYTESRPSVKLTLES